MNQTKNNYPLITITGPTASGKTNLAISLAKKYGGEIISADSRAIYKGIDIASAKPSIDDMAGVAHWGFDLVSPDDKFTAYDFKLYAVSKIKDIVSRGKIPFLVGGTGLYIDSVLYDYSFGSAPDDQLRTELNKLNIQNLIDYCSKNDIILPEGSKNKRYIIRAIERSDSNEGCKKDIDKNNIVVGITTDRDVLRDRIYQRNVEMLKRGVVNEAILLAKKYGWHSEPMKANAYPLIYEYIKGSVSEDELLQKMSTVDWRLAKRQVTFMKRNKDIVWFNLKHAEEYIISSLKERNI